MKINDSINGVSAARRTRELRAREGRPGSAQGATADSGDSVDLTRASLQLRAMEESLADVPVMDTAKIESLRQAIAEGRFTVDEDLVAERLVKSILEQLRHRKSG